MRVVPRSGLWSEVLNLASGTGSERAEVASVAEGKPSASRSPRSLAKRYRRMFRVGLMSSMNSIRVDCRVRKTPSIAEVTALEFCFSTPRMIMQR